jgi:hypothetical protein
MELSHESNPPHALAADRHSAPPYFRSATPFPERPLIVSERATHFPVSWQADAGFSSSLGPLVSEHAHVGVQARAYVRGIR